jgi:hypothetical protein
MRLHEITDFRNGGEENEDFGDTNEYNIYLCTHENTVELGYNVAKGTEYLCRYKGVSL